MDKNNLFGKRAVLISCAAALIILEIIALTASNITSLFEKRISSLSESGKVDSAVKTLEIFQLVMPENTDAKVFSGCKYDIAEGMYDIGRFSDASMIFSELGEYENSVEMIKACQYGEAMQYFKNGEYQTAAEQFKLLGGYSDSGNRYKECLFAIAEKTYASGDFASAISQFIALGDFPNAGDRAYEIALEITGDENIALGMASNSMSPETMELVIRISSAREKLGVGKIAAGRSHTVALRSDGTVAAAGSNAQGQCNVSGWTDIVQVAAGADFTLGLRSDGTVVAAGSSKYGQCKVGDWSNVKSIAAGDYDALAVTKDGKLLAAGYHDYSDLLLLQNVAEVFAGAYHAVCLQDDGSAVSSNISAATSLKPICVALTTAMSVNLMADGTTSSDFKAMPKWENMVHIDANSRGVLGITADGEVKSFFFRKSDNVSFELGGAKIIAADAGGGHYVFLSDDGRVFAFGDNESGQCDVSSWQL